MSSQLEKLNSEQKDAVLHIDGPLLIIAGAGTGKTHLLTTKIAYLIEQGLAKSDEILALTFTDKAAGEMEERVDCLLPYGYVDLWISTFHSFCERILKNHGTEIGLPDFKLLSTTDAWMLMRKNFDKFDLDYYKPMGNPTKFIHSLLTHFSRAKDEIITPQEYLKYAEEVKLNGDIPPHLTSPRIQGEEGEAEEKKKLLEVANAYHTYNQLLLDEGALDFGDLINYTYKLLKERKGVLKEYQNKFKYILVDEFQDTNFAQYELIKLLAEPNNNLTVVGDDDQSIYRFRGASMSNILTFDKDFSNAKRVVLVKNYRTGQKILDTSYEFIKQNDPNRLEASLDNLSKKLVSQIKSEGEVIIIEEPSLEEEVAGVMKKIIELKKKDKEATWSDFGILVRANESAKPFIHQAEILGLPYEFLASRGLYSKPVINWTISFIKLLDNYRESSAMHSVLTMPIWGLSAYQVADISYYAKKKAVSLYEACEHVELYVKNESLISKIKEIIIFINKSREEAKHKNPSQIIYRFLQDSGLLKYLTGLPDGKEKRNSFAYLNKFYKKVKEFERIHEGINLKDYLEVLDMEFEAGEQGSLPYDPTEGPEMIKIMTIHGAKGLEFKYVFIVSLVDKRFPSIERKETITLPNELIKETLPKGDIHTEEERRLFYVACTRAKEKLFLTWAKDYGGARLKKPSRFLYETGLIKEIKQENNKAMKQNSEFKEQKAMANDEHKNYPLPKHFSYSQIKAFRTCPYQYQLRFILNIPTEAGYQASFGRSIHNTLEKFLSIIKNINSANQTDLFEKKEKKLFPSLKNLEDIYKAEWIDEWYESRESSDAHKKSGWQALKTYYEKMKNNPPKPLFLEQEFTLKFGKDSFKGVIDRIDDNADKTISIIDYKTGSSPKEGKLTLDHKEQLLIYSIATKQLLDLEPKNLILNYITEEKEFSFEATVKDVEKIQERIISDIEKIKLFDFKATPGEHECKFCDYKNICEYRK
ncbi:ATP-dependent helicase [Candidatus Parcubacteria bacterium]|nr:ATP-dependent helicase [Patescibacteria group bacterium]MCG2693820.1 ATP-dependent helicase [Candidatus Parcubacteria bacterium]